ncbi:SLOG family protein [Paenibacillus sp. HB172176]|uniref:SLOG family protein n=1 Tax=Paenibacillus sp. HB172176 TaxID=2493690 RepID=UPI00143BF360|nr:SLOG family protein [Paenibacillus sp. HB172176]
MKTVLITGYRAHELNIFNQKHPGIPFIKQAIANKLLPLLEEGLEWVITPGGFGVDLWACEAAIAFKPQFPKLKLSILTAFSNPEQDWKDDKKHYYQQLLKDVDYYAAVHKGSYSNPRQFAARDNLLLRKSDAMIVVYDEEASGSPRFMLQKAMQRQQRDGYPIFFVSFDDIQSLADESADF